MKEKTKSILLALFMILMAIVAFYYASQHYVLVLFDTVELPEWMFDVCAYGIGALMGIGGIVILKQIFRKE